MLALIIDLFQSTIMVDLDLNNTTTIINIIKLALDFISSTLFIILISIIKVRCPFELEIIALFSFLMRY